MRHGESDSVSNSIETWPGTAIEPPLVSRTFAGLMPRSVRTKLSDGSATLSDGTEGTGGDPDQSREAGSRLNSTLGRGGVPNKLKLRLVGNPHSRSTRVQTQSSCRCRQMGSYSRLVTKIRLQDLDSGSASNAMLGNGRVHSAGQMRELALTAGSRAPGRFSLSTPTRYVTFALARGVDRVVARPPRAGRGQSSYKGATRCAGRP